MAEVPDDVALDLDEDFEVWARLSARMFRRNVAERARIVHDAGIDERWRELDARCFDLLASDLAKGQTSRFERYLALCDESRRAREDDGARVPSPLDEIFDENTTTSSRPPPPRRRANDSVTPPFARALTPGGPRPSRPLPGQSSTSVIKRDLRQAIAAGEAAATWTVEKYAWLCAELEADPGRHEAIFGSLGIGGETAAEAVHGIWESRLRSDPALTLRHRELTARFLAAIRRGDRGARPW